MKGHEILMLDGEGEWARKDYSRKKIIDDQMAKNYKNDVERCGER